MIFPSWLKWCFMFLVKFLRKWHSSWPSFSRHPPQTLHKSHQNSPTGISLLTEIFSLFDLSFFFFFFGKKCRKSGVCFPNLSLSYSEHPPICLSRCLDCIWIPQFLAKNIFFYSSQNLVELYQFGRAVPFIFHSTICIWCTVRFGPTV